MSVALDPAWLAAHPLPDFGGAKDKNSRGTLLVIGGGPGAPAAPLLTAEAGFRAGCGKVRIAIAAAMVPALAVAMPEAGFVALATDAEGNIAADSAEALSLHRIDAIVIGCGTSGCEAMAILVAQFLERAPSDVPILLDAGACVSAARSAEAIRARGDMVLLTPHPGELARLLDVEEEAVTADPDRAIDQVIEHFGATVALRSVDTRIGGRDGRRLLYPGGGVGLAVAGSGDVGVGAIGGILARGADPFVAAAWGVWAHGEAGRAKGAPGFLARELLPLLPSMLSR